MKRDGFITEIYSRFHSINQTILYETNGLTTARLMERDIMHSMYV